MKNVLLILPFLLTTCLCFAQEETEHQEQLSENELKINMFEILVMPAVGITYERFITNNSSWGAYGFVNFNSDEIYRSEKFELAPFYRIYFQKKKAVNNKGFYTEIFTGINLGETQFYDDGFDYYTPGDLVSQEYLGISLGMTLGYKFVNHSKHSIELFAGAGRFLNDQYISAYPRIGVSIGKRF